MELRLQAWTERGKSNLARILQKSDTKNYRKINVASNKGHLGGRANKQWNTIPPHTKTFTDQENQPPNKELHGLKECGKYEYCLCVYMHYCIICIEISLKGCCGINIQ